jgi:hypothetical protein
MMFLSPDDATQFLAARLAATPTGIALYSEDDSVGVLVTQADGLSLTAWLCVYPEDHDLRALGRTMLAEITVAWAMQRMRRPRCEVQP